MKSLEEVIKYKLNFLPLGTEPFYAFQTYTVERGTNPRPNFYNIYRTKNPVFFNDSYSFMEDITPLFIYISSCDRYYRENDHKKMYNILIKLIDENYESLDFGTSLDFGDSTFDFREHKISNLKKSKDNFYLRVGYYARYTKPFKILFKGSFVHILTEEEEIQRELEVRAAEEAYYRNEDYYIDQGYYRPGGYPADEDDSEDDTGIREDFTINDSRTFKLEHCIICLEEEPKVLFCNCGHLCICEKCLVRRFDNCPVCKKENTILRIIE